MATNLTSTLKAQTNFTGISFTMNEISTAFCDGYCDFQDFDPITSTLLYTPGGINQIKKGLPMTAYRKDIDVDNQLAIHNQNSMLMAWAFSQVPDHDFFKLSSSTSMGFEKLGSTGHIVDSLSPQATAAEIFETLQNFGIQGYSLVGTNICGGLQLADKERNACMDWAKLSLVMPLAKFY